MVQKLLLSILLLVFTGCTSKEQHYYILSTAKQPAQSFTCARSIGVEKVMLPDYMDKRKLTVATSSNQIVQTDAVKWAEDMDEGLTKRLVSFLQKKCRQPKVFVYPWGVDTQPELKVRVQVNRFLAQGNMVYLDVSYVVYDLSSKRSRAYLFNTSVRTTGLSRDIVSAMDKAFGRLEEHIALHVM